MEFSKEHRAKLRKAKIGKPSPNKGRKMSLEQRMKISASMKGARNGNYKGGYVVPAWRGSKLWRSIKKEVRQRARGRCEVCGIKDECESCGRNNMHVDHIERAEDRPDLIFELSNLRLLCRGHHQDTKTFGFRGVKSTARRAEKIAQ